MVSPLHLRTWRRRSPTGSPPICAIRRRLVTAFRLARSNSLSTASPKAGSQPWGSILLSLPSHRPVSGCVRGSSSPWLVCAAACGSLFRPVGACALHLTLGRVALLQNVFKLRDKGLCPHHVGTAVTNLLRNRKGFLIPTEFAQQGRQVELDLRALRCET